jgi:phosphoribosylformimino-5-aminoimidazole carboxamide ribotide isomerase
MELIPALDLRGGRVVRLRQGDFATERCYGEDPLLLAEGFAAQGFRRLHLVDLDGAEAGQPRQLRLIARIVNAFAGEVQIGGGLRGAADLEAAFAAGAARVVLGSAALADPGRFAEWLGCYGPERLVLALDAREEAGCYRVRVAGWREDGGLQLFEALQRFAGLGVRWVLCTDIARDGMLFGPNLALYQAIRAAHPSLALIASGGIRDDADLAALAALGVEAAVAGRALLEGLLKVPTAC